MPFYLGRKAIRKVPGRVIKAAPDKQIAAIRELLDRKKGY